MSLQPTATFSGASIRRTKVRHAFVGIVLFYALFIVYPQTGQNVSGNPALGEYLRSFVAYGIIAVALVLSSDNPKEAPAQPPWTRVTLRGEFMVFDCM